MRAVTEQYNPPKTRLCCHFSFTIRSQRFTHTHRQEMTQPKSFINVTCYGGTLCVQPLNHACFNSKRDAKSATCRLPFQKFEAYETPELRCKYDTALFQIGSHSPCMIGATILLHNPCCSAHITYPSSIYQLFTVLPFFLGN